MDIADDAFLRYDVGPDSKTAFPAWASGSAAAYVRQPPHGRALSLNLHGPMVDAAALINALPDIWQAAADAHPDLAGLSVEAHLVGAVRGRLGSAYSMELMGAWRWLFTNDVIVTESRWQPEELDDRCDKEKLLEFYQMANPKAESEPGEGTSRYWLGIRDHGRLAAVGAIHLTPAGAPHLTGIAVHPEYRRHGMGAAVTVALTNRAVEQAGVATLGVMTDNVAALGLYNRLGYAVAHAWCSHLIRR